MHERLHEFDSGILVGQPGAVLAKSDRHRPSETWYNEVAPPPRLAGWIASLWETRIPDLGAAQVRIMPNACVDLVFYVSDPSWGEGPAAVVAPPHRSYVVGSTLRSFMVRSVGWRHIVGASLLPAGVEPLLGLPARVIGESVAFLRDVIGKRADEWENRVIDGPTDGALGRLTRALQEVRPNREANSVVVEAVRLVRDAQGRTRAEVIAFPEMCLTGYWHVRKLSRAAFEALAEPIPDGPSTRDLLDLSREHGMTIGAGLLERAPPPDGGVYNAYVVAMPDGTW